MSTRTLLARALAHRRAGRLAPAESIYRQILGREFDNIEALHQLGAVLGAMGKVEDAAVQFRSALALDPERSQSLRALGLACLALARPAEAVEPLARLAALEPDDPAVLAQLGRAQYWAQQHEAAFANLSRVLALRPKDAESRAMVGSILHAQGKFEDAVAEYRAALLEQPDLPGALFGLGLLLEREQQRPAEAIPFFERLVAAAPDHAEGQAELGNAHRAIQSLDPAIAAYRRYLALRPGSAFAHVLLGQTLSEVGRKDEALALFERALALEPPKALCQIIHIDVGNTLQDLGRTAEARKSFARALALEPLVTRKAAKAKADFAALLVLMPGANNTPCDYLIDRAPFDSHVLLLLPDREYDVPFLAAHADVVINLVSDADQGGADLPHVARLIDRLDKPVLNHPERIARTGRQSIAASLASIRGCRVAHIERRVGTALAQGGLPPFPFLARLVGRHCGDEFEMIEDAADLERLAARNPGADLYLLDYLDYRSADGLFRKYRFFFVGNDFFPYHLAIGSGWKVHHFSTDMALQPVLQQEEEAFLRAPSEVFALQHFGTLHTIRDAIGLDFFGIDCSLDAGGNLVVFEAYASMLVHDSNHTFPYKSPYARRIKAAFAELLAARANL